MFNSCYLKRTDVTINVLCCNFYAKTGPVRNPTHAHASAVWIIYFSLSLSLSLKTRYSSSLSIFKTKIAQKITEAPPYFNFGKRRTTILHTKLRHNSVLNIDLCWCDLISSSLCFCGKVEDINHFFFLGP